MPLDTPSPSAPHRRPPARVAGRVDLVPEPRRADEERHEQRGRRPATRPATPRSRRRSRRSAAAAAIGRRGGDGLRRPRRRSASRRRSVTVTVRLQVRLEHHRGRDLVDDLPLRVARAPRPRSAPLRDHRGEPLVVRPRSARSGAARGAPRSRLERGRSRRARPAPTAPRQPDHDRSASLVPGRGDDRRVVARPGHPSARAPRAATRAARRGRRGRGRSAAAPRSTPRIRRGIDGLGSSASLRPRSAPSFRCQPRARRRAPPTFWPPPCTKSGFLAVPPPSSFATGAADLGRRDAAARPGPC